MELKDIIFYPHNDAGADDIEVIAEHKKLIEENKFRDAVSLLNEKCNKGYRASLLNFIQEKLRKIQIYLLNKTANPDEFYSFDEPSEEAIGEKHFWIQPY